MRILLFIFFILLTYFDLQAQIKFDFINDSSFKQRGTEFLKLVDKDSLSNYDFQIRFWPSDGWVRRTPVINLLVISFKNKIWTANVYTFTIINNNRPEQKTEVRSRAILSLDYDSLFKTLLADGLFSIKSMNTEEINKIGFAKTGDVVVLMEGGHYYTIELLTPSKGKKLTYNSPNTYYDAYKLSELEQPIKILKSLLHIMGLNGPS
jgi:hypothetical protein